MEGLNNWIKNSDKRGISIGLGNLGDYYYEVDSLNQAKKYYFEALGYLSNSGDAESLKSLYNSIHLVYLEEQNYKLAYEYFIKAKNIGDELLNSQAIKKIANLEWEQRFERAKEEQELKRTKLYFYIIALVTLCCFIILLILFFFHKQKVQLKNEKLANENSELKRKQIESELELKNKELTNYTLQLVRNDEIFEHVIERLEDSKTNFKRENQKVIQSIIFDLKSEQKADSWKEFEIRFLEVHHDFYSNLNDRFKDLTQNEQRLCAFLRLNMSTKEISAITNQTPHSINIARGRLRKKLNISGTNQNIHQLLSQF
jgi:DNA-binding CsgD family transcriptional regulator